MIPVTIIAKLSRHAQQYVQLMCKQTSEPSGNTDCQYRHTSISGVMDMNEIKFKKSIHLAWQI